MSKDLRNLPIGVFDSGLGGITVLKRLLEILPNEDYIYIADLANNPYGEKNRQELNEIVKKIFELFKNLGVKAIVIACNTASTLNIDDFRKTYGIPVFTVIDAAIDGIEKEYKKILLAATTATINANVYDEKLYEKFPNTYLYKQACKDLVPAIENGSSNDNFNQNLVDSYIKKYKEEDIELLVLGCTHYPIWQKYFKSSIGENTVIYDPAVNLSKMTYNYLERQKILSNINLGEVIAFTTDKLEKFKSNVSDIFPEINFKDIKKI